VSVVLLDVRPRAAYDAGHLPGAVHVDPELDLSAVGADPAQGGRHPLPGDARLEAVFARAGVGEGSFVLAVDDGSGWGARCWWLLRHLGHDDAGTLDLRAYTGPLETEAVVPPTAAFRARPRTDDTITGEEILARLGDPSLLLLDARSGPRFRGDEETLDPVAGRIPGAVNAPFTEPLPDGAATASELVTYCGSGVTACVLAQKLVLAGRTDVRLYPGSFSEWCRRASYPVQKGSA